MAIGFGTLVLILRADSLLGFALRAILSGVVLGGLLAATFRAMPEPMIDDGSLLVGVSFFFFWIFSVALLLLGCVGGGVLALVEFVFRRLSEHPKGPIFALSALLTALGSLFKLFL